METVMVIMFFTSIITAYFLWFTFMARALRGPRVWPIVGSLPSLIENNHRLHDWIAENLYTCGGTYQTCILAIPFLSCKQRLVTITCDPCNMEHMLKTRFDNYHKGPTLQAVFHDLLGQGIFNSDGDTWLFQRKTAAHKFTPRAVRQAIAPWVSQVVKLRLCPILKAAQLEAKPVDLQDLLLRLTFDNICNLALGKDPKTLSPGLPENVFATALDRATEALFQRLILPKIVWKLKKWFQLGMEAELSRSLGHIDKYISSIINVRKLELINGIQPNDLLSQFIRKESYFNVSLQHVALNFIIAGRNSSSVALSWFFWILMKNPTVEDKILREICTVLLETRGRDTMMWMEDPLMFGEVERLVYLKAALTESLRLYPSVPEDSKHTVKDDVLPDGTFVPAGSSVIYSIYSAGRMKSIWGEDCLEFRPERWLTVNGSWFEPLDSCKFIAFNAGPRTCLGKDLAYFQMKSITAALLLRHQLTLVPGHCVEQKRSLTLFMRYGLKVNVHPRDLGAIVATLTPSTSV